MTTVAQILNPEFPRSWHEVVAVVQEVASQLHPGLAMPSPQDLVLEESGAILFGFANESSANPVSALGGLLQGLLEGVEAPSALRDLGDENAGPNPAHATVESFSRALAFFERPNRASDLAALAGRLRSFSHRVDTEQEYARLREKVAGRGEEEKPVEKAPARKPRLTKRQQMLVAAAIVILLPGVMAVQFGAPAGVRLGHVMGDNGLGGLVSAALDRLGISNRTQAAPSQAVAALPANEPVEAASATAERAAAPRKPAASPAPAATRGTSVPAPARDRAAEPARIEPLPPPAVPVTPSIGRSAVASPPPVAPRRAAPRTEVTGLRAMMPGLIYTRDDGEVMPPALMRPQLPREPAPGAETGYFDLLIDETGTVEQVKLISPARRFQDRMLVAAAKAWKFKPATLHGEPVKYRVRVPIILPLGMP